MVKYAFPEYNEASLNIKFCLEKSQDIQFTITYDRKSGLISF